MSTIARDAEMIDVLIQDDIRFFTEDEDGIELLHDILYDGHIGYINLSTTELEDELVARGLPVPEYADEM